MTLKKEISENSEKVLTYVHTYVIMNYRLNKKATDRKAVVTMKHNDQTKEVTDMAMTKTELVAFMEALIIISEKSDSKEEVTKELKRIQDKMNEPNAQAVASETR
jgi:hypothetical protein